MSLPLLNDVADYYESKLKEFGPTPNGVDWKDQASQELRFSQLTKIVPINVKATLLDYGCGYGALANYLSSTKLNVDYFGFDISEKMLSQAKISNPTIKPENWFLDSKKLKVCDFTIASGIFNVRIEHTIDDWRAYVEKTLQEIDQVSSRGFSFNLLTSYSDEDKKREHLYYADPGAWFDYCKKHFSRNVALLHDYDLYEFTLLVRKSL